MISPGRASWERSNPSGTIRTGTQIKIKHKNTISSVNRRKADVQLTGGGPAPDPFTPAEELALSFNRGRPLMDGIEGGTASDTVDPSLFSVYIKGDRLKLRRPSQPWRLCRMETQAHPREGQAPVLGANKGRH
ncbi:hypothetical protein AAFF_G00322420 [Aldrovandia affinis]|uniref:Uncharacterized protein n=1 Tax=Aldrovandia affinis TaxID=143900 RepID=A0AAD7WQ32_9TELE|nr:hypothetical protein AAFF_G00322420 [Aldrovandia affinis]